MIDAPYIDAAYLIVLVVLIGLGIKTLMRHASARRHLAAVEAASPREKRTARA